MPRLLEMSGICHSMHTRRPKPGKAGIQKKQSKRSGDLTESIQVLDWVLAGFSCDSHKPYACRQ
jgi:hypothetical protein